MLKKFREFLGESESGYIRVKSLEDYEKHVAAHHPDAKKVEHKNNITQHVVGPRQNVVAHWDDELGHGKIKKSPHVKEELDLTEGEYKPEEGHKVKVVAKGMQHSGKSGYVHQVSPSGSHAGVQDKNGKHIGYYHASDLKKMKDD